VNGFGDLERQLKKIEQTIKKEVDGEIAFADLFNASFMSRYSKLTNIEEFFEKSPFKIETQEDLESIDEEELNNYVRETTSFATWEAMQGKAIDMYMERKLKKIF
jgi:hypothetical protein